MSPPIDLQIRVGTPSYPVLDAYRRDRSRVAIIRGPLGSGKTYGSVQRILQTAIEQAPNAAGDRPTRWLAIRNTYGDLEQTTAKDFLAIFGQLGEMRWSDPPTFSMHVALPDGTFAKMECIFLALDREDAIRKLRGFQVTGGWLNETKELVKPVLDMLDLRHGRYPSMADGGVSPTWHGIIGDTNSWDEDHYLWKLAHDVPEGWRFFHQPGGVIKDPATGKWHENPDAENLRNLPEGYYVRGMAGKAEDWIAVNLGNEYGFTIDGKPVHPAYVDSVHCTRDPIPFDPSLPIVLGIDYGRTPAAAICQHIPQWARTVVIDEFVTEDMSASDFGPALKRYLDQHYPGKVKGWSDPAGDSAGQATNDTPRQVVVAAGIPVLPAPSNSPILRRAAVSRPLQRLCADGRPALLVSPKAKMIRKGLAGGWCFRRLKVSGQERFTSDPDKNQYSHVCFNMDTLVSTPTGLVGISELKVGDFVLTPFGPRRISATGSRMAKVIRLEMPHKTIVCTPDHPFLVGRGEWMSANLLSGSTHTMRENDAIWTLQSCLRSAQLLSMQFMSSMGSGITGAVATGAPEPAGQTRAFFIGTSGSQQTGQSRLVAQSTIATGIQRTAGSVILSALQTERMRESTLEHQSTEIWRGSSSSNTLSPGRQNGAGGTQAGPRRLLRSARKPELPRGSGQGEYRERAFSAVNRSMSTGFRPTERSGALRNAAPLLVDRVFNLTVEGEHCYYADGYLVSNCEGLEYALLGLGEGQAATRAADWDDADGWQTEADPW